jgi:hypothetical protein
MRNIRQVMYAAILFFASLGLSNSIIASQQTVEKLPSTWDLIRQEMTKKAEPNNPVQSTRTVQPLQPTQPVKPAESVKPAEPVKMQQVESQTKERVLHFPKDRSIGRLLIGDVKASSELNPKHLFEEIEWEGFGDAQGDVKIPQSKVVRLTLASWTWQNPANLSVLKQLNPDDIYSLILSTQWSAGNVNPDNKCMPSIAYLTGLNTLNLYGANISAKGLEYLTKIKTLERLYCPDNLNDSGMTAISKLTSLKTLYITGNNTVTNKGLTQLSNLKLLDNLGLNAVNMTDEGLKSLNGLESLRYLALTGNFTSDAFIYLKNIKSLISIEIVGMKSFDDKGLEYMSGITQLENLNAHSIQSITDRGITYLRNMPNLKKLVIHNAKITDKAMLDLKEIKTLEYIDLPAFGITDEGMKNIGALKNLKYIWVGATSSSPLTDDSLRSIGQLKNLESLNIAGKGIGDEGMKYISQLPKLKRLWLLMAGALTNQGLDELAKSESLTNIILGENSNVTVSGLKSLNRLKTLKSLNIGDIRQDNSSVIDLSGLTQLDNLEITLHSVRQQDKTEVYDSFKEQDLAFLSNLNNLTGISIRGRGITDNTTKYLTGLKSPKFLTISTCGETKMTDESIKGLTDLKQLYLINIAGHFTDKSLEYLSGMPALRSLTLTSDIALSSKAIRTFKQKNPNVTDLQIRSP